MRTLFTAWAPFNPGEWFQLSMQLFYNPAHLVLVLNHRRVNRTWGAIRDHPVHVAVGGDYLEPRHFKRYFLEFDREALLKLFGGPFDRLQMNIAWFWSQANEAIFFQRRHKEFAKSMNKLEIFSGRLPTIPQHRLRLNPFLFIGSTKHFSEVIVFCFTVHVGCIPAEIYRRVVTLMGMHQINNTDAFD